MNCGLLALSGLAVAWLAAPAGAAEGPHAFFSDPAQCGRCHTAADGPAPGLPGLRRDVVSLCLECHREKDLASLHPVDIRPGLRVPQDLPLDEHGTITCATCHDPHGPYDAEEPYVAQSLSQRAFSLFTGRSRHRTFFLRRRNEGGELCAGCHDRSLLAAEGFHVREASVFHEYAGSAGCRRCHEDAWREWRKTPHARMARDARADPAAVLADFSGTPPFPREQVLYTLGSHWTQRYVVEKGDKLFVKAAIWSIVDKTWDTSYWIDKPWTQYCQGCHTTGFEAKGEPRFVELGVGCEACHGPGRRHAESGGSAPIVNPAELAEPLGSMVCESCHTTGHDRTGQFRFPLGYLPGKDLVRFYRGLLPKPGQDNRTFAGDDSYEDRRRQWAFWVGAFFDAKGLTCDVCKNFRGQPAAKEKPRMTPSEHCLSCHREDWPGDALHQRHLSEGVDCHRCHGPSLARGGGRHSIHDHKFLFLPPQPGGTLDPRETCSLCHRLSSASRQADRP